MAKNSFRVSVTCIMLELNFKSIYDKNIVNVLMKFCVNVL